LPTHPVISGDWIKQEIIGENLSASKFSSLLEKLKFSQKNFAFIYNADNIKIAYLFIAINKIGMRLAATRVQFACD
jgi:hypothetical protein